MVLTIANPFHSDHYLLVSKQLLANIHHIIQVDGGGLRKLELQALSPANRLLQALTANPVIESQNTTYSQCWRYSESTRARSSLDSRSNGENLFFLTE